MSFVSGSYHVGKFLIAGRDEANIVVHEKANGYSQISRTFEWAGRDDLPVMVDRRSIERLCHLNGFDEFPEKLEIGPWTLRRVSTMQQLFIYDAAMYVREDRFWITWRLRYWLLENGRKLKSRIIYTLFVWNLACVPLYEIPDWKHIGKRSK